ncbi:MAG: ParB N-terminal domain-containing protein [Clostridia bacterium]|nr:ParB N-terminal domain-containing protein [Clostridia bacterium]
MAKNFKNTESAKTIQDALQTSETLAQVVTLKMVKTDDLVDYQHNHEDITDTADLENSIREIGFTDPIEVTSFGAEEGKYTIVSGHRRRAAGVKCGIKVFPCVVKNFSSANDVSNYVLLANSQRDSAKDPLLFSKRYLMHEQYLKDANFEGNVREEIARRLGISVQQADRYAAMNKVIEPVAEMVREDMVGMSSVIPLASHTPEEQAEILSIMSGCDESLTRDTVKNIVDGYRDGKRAWSEFEVGKNVVSDAVLSPSDLSDDLKDDSDFSEDDEGEKPKARERVVPASSLESMKEEKSPEEKNGADVLRYLEKLNSCFLNPYFYEDVSEAEDVIRTMGATVKVLLDEISEISRQYDKEKVYEAVLRDIKKKLK